MKSIRDAVDWSGCMILAKRGTWTHKTICLVILCLTSAFSGQIHAQPVFQAAQIDTAPLGNRIPLILIHGLQSDPSMWTNFLNYYSAHPSLSNNFKPYTFAYKTDNTVMGPSDPNNVYDLSQKLGTNLEQNFDTKPVAILAHSLGGLVARSMMDNYFYSDHSIGSSKVSLLITLATPHHGTPIANVGFVEILDPLTVGPLVHYFFDVNNNFILNLAWDDYDEREFYFPGPNIPFNENYSKIIAYGATITSVASIPSSDQLWFDIPWSVLAGPGYGYPNDGIVPLQSALFYGVNGVPLVTIRQVDGSCDHFEIYSGQKTINAGTPIFDSIATDLATVIPLSIPVSPVISSVSPSTFTGLPIGQTQLIRVIGSGFTGGSTLIFHDSTTIYPFRVPTFVSANELDYNISTGTNQAIWTVEVTNNFKISNVGYFTVNAPSAPPQQYGSLVVNLSPAGATAAGAQWQVDGPGYYGSGQVVGYLTPGSHTISFKTVSGYTTPANQVVTINANAQTTASGTYSAINATYYTLIITANDSSRGYITPSPQGEISGNAHVYPAGSVVQLAATANTGYHFAGWSGNYSGLANPLTITIDGNKNATANFDAGDTNLGTIVVTIQPPEAAAAGVTWSIVDDVLRASGTSYSSYPRPSDWVYIHGTNGWVGAAGLVALVVGQTNYYNFAASYTNGSVVGTDPRTYFTLAGSAGHFGSTNGTGTSAQFSGSWSLAVDSSNNVFVADTGNNTIRKITAAGVVTTFAGQAGNPGFADNVGTNALFSKPIGITVDKSNNLYVADYNNSVIRKITPGGVVSTFAGSAGNPGSTDTAGGTPRFNGPVGIAVDTNGNVYVADSVNDTIRKISPAGVVTTFAGTAGVYGNTDATGSAARFNYPSGLAVDTGGNVYVADTTYSTIRKITSAGVVTTPAGFAGSAGVADGTGNAARFSYPNGVAVDSTGNVYVADTGNHIIRKMTPAGVVTTLAGLSGHSGTNDGIGSVARFNSPDGIAVDNAGNIFVADSGNQTIRATQSLTNKVDQFISFAPLPNKSAGDGPFPITATSSSGLPVYLNVLSGPATLDTNNVLTLLGGGTVNLIAWQPGNSNYNAAVPMLQSFTVSKIPQTITFGALNQQTVGDAPFPLAASSDSGLPVNYSASGPATLSGSIVALTGSGTVTITASQPGNNTYAAASNVVQTFAVLGPYNTIGSPKYATSGFGLTFYGIVGSNYVYQSSSNLVNWNTLLSFSCTNSIMNFQDTSATGYARRFYRIKPQ